MDQSQMLETVKRLLATESEQQWNAVCDELKRETRNATGGTKDYPDWWFPAVMLSGVFGKAKQNWK